MPRSDVTHCYSVSSICSLVRARSWGTLKSESSFCELLGYRICHNIDNFSFIVFVQKLRTKNLVFDGTYTIQTCYSIYGSICSVARIRRLQKDSGLSRTLKLRVNPVRLHLRIPVMFSADYRLETRNVQKMQALMCPIILADA